MDSTGTLQSIDISLIDLDVSNHRAVVEDQALKDLAESIRVHGLMEPVSVYRKLAEDRYILGFGHRRLAAHKLIGLETIRAIVHAPAPEAQIRAAQAVENLHRKDLSPLEEAQACQQLIVAINSGQDVPPTEDALDQAAAMVGRARTWFENRLALMRLSPRVQELLRTGRIYLGHAQLIARLPDQEAQEEVAGMVEAQEALNGRKGDMDPPKAIHDCREYVEDRLRDLTKVPWRLDAEFDGKPACEACPHNSVNQPGLFDGDAPKKPKCLDAKCYSEKTKVSGLAVIRASNTLAKMDKTTPANAEKALTEREAGYLKAAPVVARAKTVGKPSKKATKAEKRGQQESEAQRAQREAFETAMGKWREVRDHLLAGELRKSTARTALVLILNLSPEWDNANNDWRNDKLVTAAVKKLKPTLALLKNASAKTVLEAVEDLVPPKSDKSYWPFDEYDGIGNDIFGDAVAEALGIELAVRPKLEDFKKAEAKPVKGDKKVKA